MRFVPVKSCRGPSSRHAAPFARSFDQEPHHACQRASGPSGRVRFYCREGDRQVARSHKDRERSPERRRCRTWCAPRFRASSTQSRGVNVHLAAIEKQLRAWHKEQCKKQAPCQRSRHRAHRRHRALRALCPIRLLFKNGRHLAAWLGTDAPAQTGPEARRRLEAHLQSRRRLSAPAVWSLARPRSCARLSQQNHAPCALDAGAAGQAPKAARDCRACQ